MKKIALIWCDPVAEAAGLKESLHQVFRSDGQAWDVLSPEDEDFIERASTYDAYVISGSPRSVVDDAQSTLVRNTLNLIRKLRDTSSVPILGICFGAQSLAEALGGKVGPNPSGQFKLGVDTLKWTADADVTRWPEIAGPAALVQSHGECVLMLPPNSLHLASSAITEHEIFLIEDRFLGVQGHPEINNDLLRKVFMAYHRPLFDDAQWGAVQAQADQPLERDAVIALGRRLLTEGAL